MGIAVSYPQNSLWRKILRSRHGELIIKNGRIVLEGGREGRVGWWSKVISLLGGEKGKWFVDNLSLTLGNGMNTSFWEGPWVGAMPLRDKYTRLYHLSEQKNELVGEVGMWANGEWKWRLRWRRGLFGREIGLANELVSMLDRFKLEMNKEDSWMWLEKNHTHGFVKKAYELLSRYEQPNNRSLFERQIFSLVWKALAPRKAMSMSWRLLLDRLPTIDNLDKRGVINGGGINCSCCGVTPESANHLFVGCEPISKLWSSMVQKVGVVWTAPTTIREHFWQFSHLGNIKKVRKKLGGLWMCVVWVVWKWRNDVIFHNSRWDFRRIEEEIVGRFWAWEKALDATRTLCPVEAWRSRSLLDIWSI